MKKDDIKPIYWNKNNHLEYSVLLNYLDGMLNEGTHIAIKLHLDNCISCQSKVNEIEILLVEHGGNIESLRKQIEENAESALKVLKESNMLDQEGKETKVFSIRRIKFASGIAAGILLFFALKFFNSSQSFDANYIPISFHISASDADRGIDKSEDELFNLAVNKYINDELGLAKELFTEVCTSDIYSGNSDLLSYSNAYLGIINLQLHPENQDLISSNFQKAYDLGNDSIKAITSFFIGNIAYNEKNFQKAKDNFNNIESSKSYLHLTGKEEKIFSKMLSKLE